MVSLMSGSIWFTLVILPPVGLNTGSPVPACFFCQALGTTHKEHNVKKCPSS